MVTGPQEDAFSQEELRRFFWYGAEITNEFDRMGCRLKRKEPIRHLKDGNIISDGIALGSIQVPTNGQPIIMAGGPAEHGRLCKDRNGYFGGSSPSGTKPAGNQGKVYTGQP